MSAKQRPPMKLDLDVAALEQKAVSQPDPVKVAIEKTRPVQKQARLASGPEAKVAEVQSGKLIAVLGQPQTLRASRQKSREGKVAVQTWVSEDVRRRLKVLAAQTDVTIEEYLASAIDELLSQHKA
jgi:hypothetical protein